MNFNNAPELGSAHAPFSRTAKPENSPTMTHLIRSHFGGVLHANLPHRPERLLQINEELARIGLESELFPAIAAEPGSLGCTRTHLGMIELAKQRGWKSVFILEDDAVFEPGYEEPLKMALNLLSKLEWSLFYVGYNLIDKPEDVGPLLRVRGCYTTHAYAVHERFYDLLLQCPTTSGNYGPTGLVIDVWLAMQQKYTNHNCYATKEILVHQRPGISDLTKKFEDYAPSMRTRHQTITNL